MVTRQTVAPDTVRLPCGCVVPAPARPLELGGPDVPLEAGGMLVVCPGGGLRCTDEEAEELARCPGGRRYGLTARTVTTVTYDVAAL